MRKPWKSFFNKSFKDLFWKWDLAHWCRPSSWWWAAWWRPDPSVPCWRTWRWHWGLRNVNYIKRDKYHYSHVWLGYQCFKSSEGAAHKSAAPEVRKNWFCTFANFKAFKTTSMLLKVLNMMKTGIIAKRLTWTWWWCSDLAHLFLCRWPWSPQPSRLQWCQPVTNALNTGWFF